MTVSYSYDRASRWLNITIDGVLIGAWNVSITKRGMKRAVMSRVKDYLHSIGEHQKATCF